MRGKCLELQRQRLVRIASDGGRTTQGSTLSAPSWERLFWRHRALAVQNRPRSYAS
jgi:hypothetical protein